MYRSKKLLMLFSALTLLVCAVALSACGSSGSDSSSSTATEPAATTGAEEGGEVDPAKEYVPGVATLEQLYAGEEEKAPTEGPPVAKNVSVVWVSCGQEAPGCAAPAKAGEEAARKLGWKYHVTDAKLGVSNGNQRAVREAITLDPDVLVMYGTGCSEGQQALKEAKDAGITIIGVGSLDCDTDGGESLYELETVFSKKNTDNERFVTQWGENQAAYVIDSTAGKAKIIEVASEVPFGQVVTEAWDKVLGECGECEVVDKIPFTNEEMAPSGPLYQKFTSALVQHPEATVVLTTFNTPYTVSGLSKAVIDAGRDDLIVVGAEGDGPSNELIEGEKGLTASAAAYSSTRLAWATMDEINRFMNDEELVPEGIGQITLAKGHNLPPNGEYWEGKTPYAPEYEALWNVK
jgi:ribose transport system substrate-binding protein